MKLERGEQVFAPVIITLESAQEAALLKALCSNSGWALREVNPKRLEAFKLAIFDGLDAYVQVSQAGGLK